MDNFITILTIIDVMIAVLLIAVILVQQSKDGGFGGAPFGGAGESVFGGQAADHLTKFTVVLTALFFVVTLTLAIVTGRRPGGEKSVVEDDAAEAGISAPADSGKNVETDKEELEKIDGTDVKVPENKSSESAKDPEKITVPITDKKK